MKIFLISPVRLATPESTEEIGKYVEALEKLGHEVFWPRRDNPYQETDHIGIEICDKNFQAILGADQVHVWYLTDSTGIHFDLGGVYMLYVLHKLGIIESEIVKYEKPVVFVNRDEFIDRDETAHDFLLKGGKSHLKVLEFLTKDTRKKTKKSKRGK